MDDYETLLKKAYEKVKVVQTNSDRFEIPKVQGMVSGKNTIITNFQSISNYTRRPMEQLAKFLQRELATPGKIENGRLILSSKLNSSKVNEKIEYYTKEFVLCNECKKPDTEIVHEKGVKFKHCLACGAKSPVRSLI